MNLRDACSGMGSQGYKLHVKSLCITYRATYKILQVVPEKVEIEIQTKRKVPRVGLMLVGWGGNNGTTVTAAILANKLGLAWKTKHGTQVPFCSTRM